VEGECSRVGGSGGGCRGDEVRGRGWGKGGVKLWKSYKWQMRRECVRRHD